MGTRTTARLRRNLFAALCRGDILILSPRRLSAGGVVATEDANHPLVLVNHWRPAHLQFLHMLRRLGEVIVLSAAMNT
jgi:hypothetical protein